MKGSACPKSQEWRTQVKKGTDDFRKENCASGISAPSKLPFYGRNIPGHKQPSRAHVPQDGDLSINLHNFQLIDNYRFTFIA
jgi:hypothetical protein